VAGEECYAVKSQFVLEPEIDPSLSQPPPRRKAEIGNAKASSRTDLRSPRPKGVKLKANSPFDLNELEGQTGLSNKKWDKAIKGLTKNKLAKVEKTNTGFLVSLI